MYCIYIRFSLYLGREPDLVKVPGISPDKQELQGLETSVKMGLDLEYEKDGKLKSALKELKMTFGVAYKILL